MYRFVGEKKGKEPLPGISLECESDEDFERYCHRGRPESSRGEGVRPL